jgi:hypothetical protein
MDSALLPQLSPDKPVFPIGPTGFYAPQIDLPSGVTSFRDGKPKASVLHCGFGSLKALFEVAAKELIDVSRATNVPFVWVDDKTATGKYSEVDHLVKQGQGIVLPWAPPANYFATSRSGCFILTLHSILH